MTETQAPPLSYQSEFLFSSMLVCHKLTLSVSLGRSLGKMTGK